VIVPAWFLYIGGFSLLILGGLQMQQRPRKKDDNFYKRFVNLGTMWSLLCIAVGVGLLAIATGWWEPWFARRATPPASAPVRAPRPPDRRPHEGSSDRSPPPAGRSP
jgi:hypothetical protein